jgi:hypothetical protein
MDKATGAHYGVPTCEGCKVNFYLKTKWTIHIIECINISGLL